MANTSLAGLPEGVTQASLAATLGLHQSTVSRKLSGEIAWRVNELHVLASALNVPLSQLLGAEPSAKSAGNRVSAAPAGVRRGQISAGPTRRPKQPQPSQPDLNGRSKARKSTKK